MLVSVGLFYTQRSFPYMHKHTFLTFTMVCLCLPAFAQVDSRFIRDRDKEISRCMEKAEHFEEMEDFEKRWGWAKEHFGHQFHHLLEKRKAASKAWRDAANGIRHAQNHHHIDGTKIAAFKADSAAYIAELELRSAGMKRRWNDTADKIGTEEASRAAKDLIETQRLYVEVAKNKALNEQHLRGLDWQRVEKQKALDAEAEQERRKSNTNGRPLKKEQNDKPEGKPHPPKIIIE